MDGEIKSDIIEYLFTTDTQATITKDGKRICELLGINSQEIIAKGDASRLHEKRKFSNQSGNLYTDTAGEHEENRKAKILLIQKYLHNSLKPQVHSKRKLKTEKSSPSNTPSPNKRGFFTPSRSQSRKFLTGPGVSRDGITRQGKSESPLIFVKGYSPESLEEPFDKEIAKQQRLLKVKQNQTKLVNENVAKFRQHIRQQQKHERLYQRKKYTLELDLKSKHDVVEQQRKTQKYKVDSYKETKDMEAHKFENLYNSMQEKLMDEKELLIKRRSVNDYKSFLQKSAGKIMNESVDEQDYNVDRKLKYYYTKLARGDQINRIQKEEKLKYIRSESPKIQRIQKTFLRNLESDALHKLGKALDTKRRIGKLEKEQVRETSRQRERSAEVLRRDLEIRQRIREKIERETQLVARDINERSFLKERNLQMQKREIETERLRQIRNHQKIKQLQTTNLNKIKTDFAKFKMNVVEKHLIHEQQVETRRERQNLLFSLQEKHSQEFNQIKTPPTSILQHLPPNYFAVPDGFNKVKKITPRSSPKKRLRHSRGVSLNLTKNEVYLTEN